MVIAMDMDLVMVDMAMEDIITGKDLQIIFLITVSIEEQLMLGMDTVMDMGIGHGYGYSHNYGYGHVYGGYGGQCFGKRSFGDISQHFVQRRVAEVEPGDGYGLGYGHGYGGYGYRHSYGHHGGLYGHGYYGGW